MCRYCAIPCSLGSGPLDRPRGEPAVALDDLVESLIPQWFWNAVVRGTVLHVNFPHQLALRSGEISPVRVLLDGLVGDALEGIAGGGSVLVSVSCPRAAVLRLSVRRTGRASSPRHLQPTGRDEALDVLREVAQAHHGRFWRQRKQRGELTCVDLPRVQ